MKIEYITQPEADLQSAIETGLSDLRDDLGSEIREVVDGASGTNRENTARIQTLGETADVLENLNDPDIPAWATHIKVTWSTGKKRSKKSPYPR